MLLYIRPALRRAEIGLNSGRECIITQCVQSEGFIKEKPGDHEWLIECLSSNRKNEGTHEVGK